MISTVQNTLEWLYEEFGYAPEGDDHAHAGLSENQTHIAEELVRYWQAINAARSDAGALDWTGLLVQAQAEVDAAIDPNDKADALLRLAATALTCAASLQRQADAFNAAGTKAKAPKVEAKETGE